MNVEFGSALVGPDSNSLLTEAHAPVNCMQASGWLPKICLAGHAILLASEAALLQALVSLPQRGHAVGWNGNFWMPDSRVQHGKAIR